MKRKSLRKRYVTEEAKRKKEITEWTRKFIEKYRSDLEALARK